MGKEAVFTMKLEADLRADFMAETEALHRPASQVVRELMREFVERKVALARTSMQAGHGVGNDEVEAEFATRRARVSNQA